LVWFWLGFSLVQEEKLLVCNSRGYKIKNLPFTVAKELLGISVLVKPGFGGNFGWLSNLT
jgi:hypothetical protein